MTGISHDSVNRFLHRENYQPKDMFDEAAQSLCLVGGTLSVDDSVLDKPRTYALMTPANFGSRFSLPSTKLAMKAPTVSLNISL